MEAGKEDGFLDGYGEIWKETLLGKVERVRNGDTELSPKVSGCRLMKKAGDHVWSM